MTNPATRIPSDLNRGAHRLIPAWVAKLQAANQVGNTTRVVCCQPRESHDNVKTPPPNTSGFVLCIVGMQTSAKKDTFMRMLRDIKCPTPIVIEWLTADKKGYPCGVGLKFEGHVFEAAKRTLTIILTDPHIAGYHIDIIRTCVIPWMYEVISNIPDYYNHPANNLVALRCPPINQLKQF